MLRTVLIVFGVFLQIAAPSAVTAIVIARSTFDTGNEGWRVGDFFSATGVAMPTHVAAGGNPGGFLRTSDLFDWNAYQAPAAFLGNQSAAYGGTLHLDERILSSDGVNYPMVVLFDGSLLLQFRTVPPGSAWTSYDIPLVASAGWEIANGSGNPGPPASEAQLQQVLSNLVSCTSTLTGKLALIRSIWTMCVLSLPKCPSPSLASCCL